MSSYHSSFERGPSDCSSHPLSCAFSLHIFCPAHAYFPFSKLGDYSTNSCAAPRFFVTQQEKIIRETSRFQVSPARSPAILKASAVHQIDISTSSLFTISHVSPCPIAHRSFILTESCLRSRYQHQELEISRSLNCPALRSLPFTFGISEPHPKF